jgi:hypothetical protein
LFFAYAFGVGGVLMLRILRLTPYPGATSDGLYSLAVTALPLIIVGISSMAMDRVGKRIWLAGCIIYGAQVLLVMAMMFPLIMGIANRPLFRHEFFGTLLATAYAQFLIIPWTLFRIWRLQRHALKSNSNLGQ